MSDSKSTSGSLPEMGQPGTILPSERYQLQREKKSRSIKKQQDHETNSIKSTDKIHCINCRNYVCKSDMEPATD